jgi:hypothetical protein
LKSATRARRLAELGAVAAHGSYPVESVVDDRFGAGQRVAAKPAAS